MLKRRIKEHGTNKGSKIYTTTWSIQTSLQSFFSNRSSASKEEYRIKSLRLQDKIKLIESAC